MIVIWGMVNGGAIEREKETESEIADSTEKSNVIRKGAILRRWW